MARTKGCPRRRRRGERGRKESRYLDQQRKSLHLLEIYLHAHTQTDRTSKRESVDPINQSLMVSDVFLFVRLDEPIEKHTHTCVYTIE